MYMLAGAVVFVALLAFPMALYGLWRAGARFKKPAPRIALRSFVLALTLAPIPLFSEGGFLVAPGGVVWFFLGLGLLGGDFRPGHMHPNDLFILRWSLGTTLATWGFFFTLALYFKGLMKLTDWIAGYPHGR